MDDNQLAFDAQSRQLFRRRVFILLALILLILLLGRICSAQLAPAAPATPTQALQTDPITPIPTITTFPDDIFTPIVTFSAIPPTFVPETHTIVPSPLPQTTSTPSPLMTRTLTPSPLGTQIGCSGFGQLRGMHWIVAGCDTLTRISQVTGISLDKLLAANPEIEDPDLIYPSQRIRLPAR